MTAPVLKTERLTLRPHKIEDFEAYSAFMASDRARFMGGPLDQRAAWANFCKDVAQWALLGHGALAITETDTGIFAGQIGLNKHPYFLDMELGWLVFEGFEGHGIAYEAAMALRNWAHKTFPDIAIASYVHSHNVASKKLALRLGAKPDQTADCPYRDHVVFRHPASEILP